MLNARGDSGAGRQLAVFRLKIVITFPKKVLPSKCWQCDVLQRVFAREKCVLGTGSNYIPVPDGSGANCFKCMFLSGEKTLQILSGQDSGPNVRGAGCFSS